MPAHQTFDFKRMAAYSYTSIAMGDSAVLINRQYLLGTYLYLADEYDGMRDFLNEVAQGDQQLILFKQGADANAH
jgi:hypothetical protein